MTDAIMVDEMSLLELVAWMRNVAPGAQLSSDSRAINTGDIFFACAGEGERFIADALARGAKAVLHESKNVDWNSATEIAHQVVPELKKLSGPIASLYYGTPDTNMTSIAVTGTNGKTSCTQWLGNALSRLGDPTAVIGTLGVGLYLNGKSAEFSTTGYTTPDAVQLQRKLVELNAAGATTVAIEASSIGLEQRRLDGMHIDIALFTNLTRDHLDYHGDMRAYEAAKQRLFDWKTLSHAVINLDDDAGLRLIEHLRQHAPQVAVTGYTVSDQVVGGIDILRATDIRSSHGGTIFQLHSSDGSTQIRAQLIGRFNVSNLLGVLGVMLAKGIEFSDAIEAVEELTSVPGRMQQFGGQEAPLVVIDYAHTPDALEKTLASLRQVAGERGGKLWCVFGCGGDRDPGKRPQMGAASMAADHVVVTSDNPRTESARDIIAQIAVGITDDDVPHLEIEDRAAAILWAVRHATRADVILLAGKGHETTQEINGRKIPFLDADHAALALAARATMRGAS